MRLAVWSKLPAYNLEMTLRWTDRRFTFNLPEELLPVVVERLRGTPARIEDKVRSLSPTLLTRRDGAAWSIQEHIGHRRRAPRASPQLIQNAMRPVDQYVRRVVLANSRLPELRP
jgi:hypothetical protein